MDIGAPAIAKAVLTAESLADLDRFLKVSTTDEPILVIDAGRHGLVSEDFVRTAAPDRLAAEQDGLPVALRDANLLFETLPGVPDGTAMILRTDRRLGFDPTRDWTLKVQAVRAQGPFQPEIGAAHFTLTHKTDERFYIRPGAGAATALPPWREAIRGRRGDLLTLAAFLAALGPAAEMAETRGPRGTCRHRLPRPRQGGQGRRGGPFKTAIATFFLREWYYVACAGFRLFPGMVAFKGF